VHLSVPFPRLNADEVRVYTASQLQQSVVLALAKGTVIAVGDGPTTTRTAVHIWALEASEHDFGGILACVRDVGPIVPKACWHIPVFNVDSVRPCSAASCTGSQSSADHSHGFCCTYHDGRKRDGRRERRSLSDDIRLRLVSD
jgi:hypothetical protein